jgi:hypothetical protein
VSTPTALVSPDPFFPTQSTPTTKTPDAQSTGPSKSLVQSEATTVNRDGDPDVPEPGTEGDTKMECSSD